MLMRHWLEQIAHRCFKVVRPAKRKPTARSRRRRFDVPAVAEVLEDRVLLAAATFNPNTSVLTIDFTASGTTAENVTINNSSGTLTLTGDVSGDTTLFQQAVQRIVVMDSGGSNNQSLSILGNAFSLEDGLNSSDVENFAISADIGLVASNADISATTISIGNNALVFTEGNGTITLDASRNVLINDGNLTVRDGDLTITANPSGTATGNFDAVRIIGGSVVQSTGLGAGAGSIILTGTGGQDGTGNDGVRISDPGTRIRSANGNIILNGTGNGTLNGNNGVYINDGSVIESIGTDGNAATISITGTGANGTADNFGVLIENAGTIISSVMGNISITGNGGDGSGSSNRGVTISQAAVVESTGTGADAATIGITGVGGDGTRLNIGVIIEETGTQVISVEGNVTINGTGGNGSGDSNIGVIIETAATVNSTGIGANAATVTILGTGGAGTSFSPGVFVADADTNVTSVDGDVTITGVGGIGSGPFNDGVVITGVVQSTGTGTDAARLNIAGTGRGGSPSSRGVLISNPDSKVTSVDGDITITGTGGDGTMDSNIGVRVASGGVVESTGNGVNAAAITITGTGGDGTQNNHGVTVETTISKITSVDGDITITGTGGNGSGGFNRGVFLLSGGGVESTGTGAEAATISITGTGGNGTSENPGVRIQDAGSNVTAIDGDISITGTGGNGADGVSVSSVSPGFSTGGSLVVTGASSPIATDNGATALSQFNGQTITLNGTVSPGGSLAGELSATGAFTLANDDTLQINLNGATPFTQFDQVTVIGTVTLGGAALDVQRDTSFNPSVGDSFILIDNDGTDAVNGTFAQSSFTADGVDYIVQYDGGDGNDVVLSVAIPTNLVVDNIGDEVDGDFSADQLTLREAVQLANMQADANTITFASALTDSTITLGGTDLDISEDVTITGLGANQLTINANSASRIFDVATGTTASISDLRFTNGNATGTGANGDGGAIRNMGTLTVTDSFFAFNSAQRNGGAIASTNILNVSNTTLLLGIAGNDGGAIDAIGTTTVTNSTMTLNTAVSRGGGIYNDGTLTVTNSTLTGNLAGEHGGGLRNGRGMVTVVNSTIALNRADNDGNSTGVGGGIATFDDNTTFTTLYNTLVIGNVTGAMDTDTPDDLAQKAVEAGSSNNIVSEDPDDKLPDNNGNQVVADASTVIDLTLTDNGGPVPTQKLRLGSPAINAGNNSRATSDGSMGGTALATDQRGTNFNRIVGGTVDIGAVELQSLASVTIADANASEATGMLTFTISRSGNTDGPTSVTYTVSNGTTKNGDFPSGTLPSGLVNFAEGETSKTITVPILDDTRVETDETFTVTLTNPTPGTTIADAMAIGTILDDDTSTLTLAAINATQAEGTGGTTTAFTFSVTLTNPVDNGFSVAYSTNNNTATAGGDYIDNDGTLNFVGTSGETKTITVEVNHDRSVEADETFNVALGTISNLIAGIDAGDIAIVGSPQTGTIQNDDDLFSDLRVSKTDGDDTNVFGSLIVYTITVNNDGSDASGVTLTETLASNVQFNATASTAGWTETAPDSGTFTFNVGNLTEGQQTEVFFAVKVETTNSGTAQTINTVSVTDNGANGADINPGNNSASDTTNLIAPISTVVTSPFEASLINGTFTELHAGNFDAISTAGPQADADDLFFWDPVSGVNRIVFGDGTSQTNSIPPSFINGGDFTKVVSGNFDNVDGEDLFFWNPVTGRNRLVRLSGTTRMVSAGFENNIVEPTAINGNDFTQFVAGNFDEGGAADIFFWNPVTGRNRMVHTLPAVMGDTQSTFQTDVIPANEINGNDFQRIDVGQFVAGGPDELFFLNLSSGRNRTASFSVDMPGTRSSFAGSQTNQIGGTQLNGNAYSRVAIGDYNNDDLDDVFAWDPRTGANRVGLTNVNPDQLSEVFSNLVDPSQINGNDFSVLISRNAGEGQTVGDDELFFWNPITGRNRQAQA